MAWRGEGLRGQPQRLVGRTEHLRGQSHGLGGPTWLPSSPAMRGSSPRGAPVQTPPSSENIRASLDVVGEDLNAPEFQDCGQSNPIAGDDNSPSMPDGGLSDPCPSPKQVE
jgi:hypothetical protein